MQINEICKEDVNESSCGGTTSGAVATVAQPMSAPVKRMPKGSNLLKGIKTSKKYANSLHESVSYKEQVKAHDLLNRVGDADMSCEEIVDLLIDNRFSEELAFHMALDSGRQPPTRSGNDGKNWHDDMEKILSMNEGEHKIMRPAKGSGNAGMGTPYDQGLASAKRGDSYENIYDQPGEENEHKEYKKGYDQGVSEGAKVKNQNKLYSYELKSNSEIVEYVKKSLIPEMRLYGVKKTPHTDFMGLSSAIFEGVSKVVDSGKDLLKVFKRVDQFDKMNIKVGSKVSILCLRLSYDHGDLFGFRNPKKITKILREPTENKIIQFEFNNDPDDVWPRQPLASYNGEMILSSAFFPDAMAFDHALLLLSLANPENIKLYQAFTEGAKVDRMVGHIKSSEKKLGKSGKEAENIAWATANKRGMLDNKNKKKVKEGSHKILPLARGTGNAGMPTPYDQGLASAKRGESYENIYDQPGEEVERKDYENGYLHGKKQGVAEGEVVAFPKKHPFELLTNCPKCGGPLHGGKDEKGRLKMCIPCMALYRAPIQQGVAEADNKKEWQKQNAKPKQLGKTEKYFSTRHTTKDTGAADKEQGVAEGIGDTIKRGVKNIKRGMQGWGQLNDIPDDDPRLLPGAKDAPRQLVARNKGYDDKTVKQLARPVKSSFPFGGDDTTSPHSPRGLQKRVLDREMKKRGLGEQGVAKVRYTGGMSRQGATEDSDAKAWYLRANGKIVRTDDGQPKEFFGKKNANSAGVAYQRDNPDADVKLSTNSQDKDMFEAQSHAKKLGNEWGAYRHPSADKWDNLHIVVKKHEAPSDLKGVAEGSEQITELRDRMYQYIKSIVPAWPDYVVQDWLYKGGKTDTKDNIIEKISGAGLTPNSKWQLVPNMKFTMDMFDPMTKQRLVGRAGGTSDLGMGIPKDKERHATQAALAQQQGGVRKEPVLLIKTAKGYKLLEGWHRTIQHFAKYPEGYTGPAYVAVAQGQQGVAEADNKKDGSIGLGDKVSEGSGIEVTRPKPGVIRGTLSDVDPGTMTPEKRKKLAAFAKNYNPKSWSGKTGAHIGDDDSFLPNHEVSEGEIKESDLIRAPGKGRQFHPGLLNKPQVSVNPTDVVKLDVPLLIRLLEFAKEDAADDMALHDLAEKLVAGCARGRTLSMKDYNNLVPATPEKQMSDQFDKEMNEGPMGREIGSVVGGVAGGALGSRGGPTAMTAGRTIGATLGAEIGDHLGDKVSNWVSSKFKKPDDAVDESGDLKTSRDPILRRLSAELPGHYGDVRDPEEAFQKWVTRTIEHGKEEDLDQDIRITKIERQLADLIGGNSEEVDEDTSAQVQDWRSRRGEVQKQLMDPNLPKDPNTRAAFFRKMAALNKEGEQYGITSEDFQTGPGERA